MRAEQLTDVVTFHGEGPVWSDSWGGLRLVDLFAGDVLTLADDATVTRRHVDLGRTRSMMCLPWPL